MVVYQEMIVSTIVTLLSIVAAITALFGALVIIVLVVVAFFQEVRQVEDAVPLHPVPSADWLSMSYQTTTNLYIEVDREIWQVATIFTPASLLILGWVATNFDKLTLSLNIVLGCASIILVGLATLFKHRLRAFNLVHLSYLRRLERTVAGSEEGANFWGLHYLRRGSMISTRKFLGTMTSIHGVMDIYFFLFIILWLAIWTVGIGELVLSLNQVGPGF